MEKNKTTIILIILFLIAFALRMYLMPGHLFFGPEQGRDFLVIRDIVENHKLTLIGSKTDTSGIFHGPVYYYLASIPFALSGGNPVAVFVFFVLIQALSVFLAYQLTLEFTKSRRAGCISAALFAVSYAFVVYARWLSNPPLAIPFSMLLMLSLVRFIRGNPKYLIASAIMYGLAGQAEFINFLLFGVIGLLALVIFWKQSIRTNISVIVYSIIAGIIISAGTYILFDLRHNFLISNAVLYLVLGKGINNLTLWTSTGGAFRVLMEQVAASVGLSWWVWGLAITTLAMVAWYQKFRRDKALILLALWLWVPPVILAILRHGMLDQLYAGVISVVLVLISVAIDWIWERKKLLGIVVLLAVIGLNVWVTAGNLRDNYHVFFQPQQPAVRYNDQLSVIDWVYGHAAGRPFEFQAYTIPYFLQDAWIYLFDEYGLMKYGYKPTPVDRKLLYVIIQKDTLDPAFQLSWYTKTVSTWGRKQAGTTIGEYTVEERTAEK